MSNRIFRRCFLLLFLLLFAFQLPFGGAAAAYAESPEEPAAAVEQAPELTPEPTAEPTPEPTPTPVPELPLGDGLTVPADAEALDLVAGSFAYDALLLALPQLPSLKALTLEKTDLSAEQLAALRAALAGDAVLSYSVDIGGLVVPGDVEELDLEAGSYEYDALLQALPRLPDLKTLTLEKTDLSAEQLDALRAAMAEDAVLSFSVDIGGRVVPGDIGELDLEAGSFEYDALLQALPRLPALKKLMLEKTDLSADELGALRAALAGDAALRYTVEIAGQLVSGDAEEMDLSGMREEALPEVLEKLALLPDLKRIELKKSTGMCALGTDGIIALAAACPEVELSYSVRVGGSWYDRDTGAVNLSRLRPAQLDAALDALRLLPKLREVELMGRGGRCPFDREQVLRILKALPEAWVHYEFELFGQTLSTLDERVEYDHVVLCDDDEAAIRDALDLLTRCRYFKLDEDRFGMHNEVFASIRDDYPDVKLVWRVFIEGVNMLTDEEILRVTFVLKDYNSAPLRYCTDAVYLDIGHNSYMSDISFTAYMPRLECLILSGSIVTDLSPLENCRNLVWVECCFCGWLQDLSPLRGHDSIRFVNISDTSVSDVSALEDLKLERLVAMQCRVPLDAQQRFDEKNPDCLTAWVGEQPYGYPWRYDAIPAIPAVFSDYYRQMRELFLYDDKGYMNSKLSPYGPGYLELREGRNLVFDR